MWLNLRTPAFLAFGFPPWWQSLSTDACNTDSVKAHPPGSSTIFWGPAHAPGCDRETDYFIVGFKLESETVGTQPWKLPLWCCWSLVFAKKVQDVHASGLFCSLFQSKCSEKDMQYCRIFVCVSPYSHASILWKDTHLYDSSSSWWCQHT